MLPMGALNVGGPPLERPDRLRVVAALLPGVAGVCAGAVGGGFGVRSMRLICPRVLGTKNRNNPTQQNRNDQGKTTRMTTLQRISTGIIQYALLQNKGTRHDVHMFHG